MLSDHNEKYSDKMERSYKAFAVIFELRFPFPLMCKITSGSPIVTKFGSCKVTQPSHSFNHKDTKISKINIYYKTLNMYIQATLAVTKSYVKDES